MELGDVEILTRADTKAWLMGHRNDDPVALALSKSSNGDFPPIVYSQLKIQKKAAKKLPRWVAAGCIFTERGLEQCSSERAASIKSVSGKRCLDLSCGLGVDAVHFASSFEQVVALEPDPVLFALGKHNMHCLEVSNLELLHFKAEAWLADYNGPGFDLIYVDPDRRDAQGQRQHSPAQGRPGVLALLPLIKKHTHTLLIKASPMYDVKQASRDFPEATRLTIVSLDGEVKELLIELNFQQPTTDQYINVRCHREGRLYAAVFDDRKAILPLMDDPPEEGTFIYEPDPAFYAAHTSANLMAQEFPVLEASMSDQAGFYFSQKYTKSFPGRVFAIRECLAYKPKYLRKRFRKQSLLITRRHFPFSVHHIRKQTGIADGGNLYLICTTINGKNFAFTAERMNKM
jgi:hypothetical protein